MSELTPLPDTDLARAATYARQALAPATLAAYAADLAGTHAGATLRRRLAAIGRAQRMAGHPWSGSHPALRDTLAGIARQHGTPQRRAAALGTAEIRKLV